MRDECPSSTYRKLLHLQQLLKQTQLISAYFIEKTFKKRKEKDGID